jgi:hypothetical protein
VNEITSVCICVLFHSCRNRYVKSQPVLLVAQDFICTPKLATTSSVIFADSGWRTACSSVATAISQIFATVNAGRSFVHMRNTSQQSAIFYRLRFPPSFTSLCVTDQAFQVKMHAQAVQSCNSLLNSQSPSSSTSLFASR